MPLFDESRSDLDVQSWTKEISARAKTFLLDPQRPMIIIVLLIRVRKPHIVWLWQYCSCRSDRTMLAD